MDKKIKVLVLADAPTSSTGFAQVSRNILNKLSATGKYDFDVIGINSQGNPYDKGKFPYDIFPAMPAQTNYSDMYGRARLLLALNGELAREGFKAPYDLVFTIQDPFIIEGLGCQFPFAEQLRVTSELWKRQLPPEYWFNWVGYFPVDSELKENWVTRSIALPQYPVAYCDYGKEEILKYDRETYILNFNLKLQDGDQGRKAKIEVASLKDRIKIINHGVDLNVFKPLPEEEIKQFRKDFFGGIIKDDTFLVVNISRNQPRKDIPRTMAAYAEFKKRVPNSHLYLHMKAHDAGGSIDEIARSFNLILGKDYSMPVNFDAGTGYGVDVVNKIYNAADCCVSTTLGEGWGFITSEAMATKTPIVAPNITSIKDIFNCHERMQSLNKWLNDGGWNEVRGIPVLAGSTTSEWICMGIDDNERIRPLTNVDDLVSKMVWVFEHPSKVQAIVDRAYEWVQSLSWDNIAVQWDAVFTKAYSELEEQKKFGKILDETNRNDPCPCGSGKKFKKCHGIEKQYSRVEDLVGE